MSSLYTVDDTIAGYFNLLAAVLNLAARDAQVDPEHYQNKDNKNAAIKNKDEAEWFLNHVDYFRRTSAS